MIIRELPPALSRMIESPYIHKGANAPTSECSLHMHIAIIIFGRRLCACEDGSTFAHANFSSITYQ